MGVLRAADVLERDAPDLVREQPGLRGKRLQAGVLHLEVAQHLLDQQQRIRSHVNVALAVRLRPFQRREQPAILRDVVRRRADRFAELFDGRAVGPLDADAETGRTGIAPRTAVDVGDDAHVVAWVAAGAGTK